MQNKTKKHFAKLCSLALSATMFATSVQIPAFAQQTADPNPQEETDVQIVSENEASYADEGFEWEPDYSFDWFEYDWKDASDEELDDHLLSVSHEDTRDFLLSLSEEETQDILSRETSLTGHYTLTTGDPETEEETVQEWDTYYDYLVSIPQSLKWTSKSNIANDNVYMTINVYNGSTKVNSLKLTYTNIKSVIGAGTSSKTHFKGLTVGAVEQNTSSPFRIYMTGGGTATWKNGSGASSYEIVCLHLATSKPVGYSFSYQGKTIDYNNDPDDSDPKLSYLVKDSFTKDSAADVLSGGTALPANGTTGSAATITTSLLINLKHFGIHTKTPNFHQVSNFVYTPVTYYVTYDGGSKQSCVYGSTYSRLGKQADKTGQYTIYLSDIPHNSESTMKASWKQPWLNWKNGSSTFAAGSTFSNLANTATTINYTSNYGAVTVDSVSLPTPDKYGTQPFIGWGDSNGNLIVSKGASYKPSGNITLYAQYGDPEKCTLTVNANGGTFTVNQSGVARSNQTTASSAGVLVGGNARYDKLHGEFQCYGGQDFVLHSWARPGYSFKGFVSDDYVSSDNSSYTDFTISKSGVIKLDWEANAYTITYNAGEGATVSPASATVIFDQQCPIAPIPEKTGYTFKEWAPKENGMQSSGVYKYNGDSYVNAVYDANTYFVSFDLDGGEGSAETMTVAYDQEFTLPDAPIKEGYDFIGWEIGTDAYSAKDKVKNLTSKDKDTIVAKAKFEPQKYTVKFNSNGGSPINDQVYTYGDTTALPTLTRTGFTFTGWRAGLNETFTTAADIINKLKNKPISQREIELTACWDGDAPNPTPTPSQVDPELKKALMEILEKIQKTSELTAGQLQELMDVLTSQYFLTESQAKTLFNLIKNNNALTEEQKLSLLKALASGTLTEDQKSLLVALISKSSLSDADKKALLAAISGISSLTAEQQQKILEALEKGSSAEIQLGGVTYTLTKTKDGTISVSIKGLNGVKDVTIPDFVTVAGKTYPITEIAPGAFKGNTDVNSVKMGDNISTIGESAFEGAKNLKSIVFSEHLKEIGPKAFKGCTSLGKSVTLPAALQTIGASAFEGCTKLETIVIKDPSKLLEIGKKAFYNTSLKSFKVPKSVLKIQEGAFASNKKMTKFTFEKGSALVSLGKGVWEKDAKLKSIKLPSKIAKVPAKAFKGCKALKSCKLASGTTDIGASAFEGCIALKSFTVPSKVISIGNKAFYGDKKLGKVTFKGKILSKVGSKAFKKCKKNITFRCPKNKLGDYKKKLKGKY